MKASTLNALIVTCLLNTLPVAASAQPFTLSADGSEVTDQNTGLIWKRCSEGMSWNGSICAGTAAVFTHEAALTQAGTQAISTGVAWRLPNVKELSSIADKTRINPAIDPAAFPVTPASWFWSSSPSAGGPTSAWYVYFLNGLVFHGDRFNSYYVRLVRAGQ